MAFKLLLLPQKDLPLSSSVRHDRIISVETNPETTPTEQKEDTQENFCLYSMASVRTKSHTINTVKTIKNIMATPMPSGQSHNKGNESGAFWIRAEEDAALLLSTIGGGGCVSGVLRGSSCALLSW